MSAHIRRLSEATINRIAAGEVVERPASAVKELVENALDAQSRAIDVHIADGGKSLIAVSDDGVGMGPADLSLAVERHATSKLALDENGREDLVHIRSLGFRGEALPSIASVSRLRVVSRPRGGEGHELRVEAGRKTGPEPAAHGDGTLVEVRDLFFATPARAKFLKTAQAESAAVSDIVRRLAMANPSVAFTLRSEGRVILRAAPGDLIARLATILGQEFADNAVAVGVEREGVRIDGFAGLPTLNRASAQMQYLFVNGRAVKDRLLTGAVRGAYADFLARDRHPSLALFVSVPPELVDVNVHPAKTEVRFRDAGLVRGLIVSGLKHALHEAGHRASTSVAASILAPVARAPLAPQPQTFGFAEPEPPPYQAAPRPFAPAASSETHVASSAQETGGSPLGVARAQLHETYIVAQSANGIVIVDQHAAHERLVYERMKHAMAEGGISRQILLIPEVVEIGAEAADRLTAKAEAFAELGLVLEAFGDGAILVREVPSILGDTDVQGLVKDLADEIEELGEGLSLKEAIEHLCGTIACHGSVRAGRPILQRR